jgi:hypothetical protein
MLVVVRRHKVASSDARILLLYIICTCALLIIDKFNFSYLPEKQHFEHLKNSYRLQKMLARILNKIPYIYTIYASTVPVSFGKRLKLHRRRREGREIKNFGELFSHSKEQCLQVGSLFLLENRSAMLFKLTIVGLHKSDVIEWVHWFYKSYDELQRKEE